MENENIEATVENQILTKEEIAEVESLKDTKEEELTPDQKANKKLYARMKEYKTKFDESKKSHEEEIAKIKAELEEAKKKPNGDTNNNTDKKEVELDPIEFAKRVRSLSSLEDEEISYAQILAKGMDKSVDDAIKTNEFKVWSEARKEQIKKEKGLDPDGRKAAEQKKDEFFEKFSANLPKGFDFKK